MKTSFLAHPLIFCTLAFPLLVPGAASEAGTTEAEIAACVQRNAPQSDSIRAVRISSKDRTGEERETLIKIYSRPQEDGLRRVSVEFIEPEDLKGASFLMLEREGPNEMYFRTAKDAKAKRVSGAARSLGLFGSDITYEDFEHLMAFRRPEESKRLPDETHRDREVYVVETRSADSSYDRIVTSIDKERCVALRAELYEKGKGLRKELSVNPNRVLKRGAVWVPQVAVMTDLRDGTSTMFLIDSTEQDVAMDDSLFSVEPAVGARP